MAAFVDQPLNCQLLAPPPELPANVTTLWLLPKPTALAEPSPVEGLGLPLAPGERLSKDQVARVVAACAPDSEAASIDAIQAMFFIFI
jgi:hypothetical protein